MFKLIMTSSCNIFKLTIASPYFSTSLCGEPIHNVQINEDEPIYYIQTNNGKPLCFINFFDMASPYVMLKLFMTSSYTAFELIMVAYALHQILNMVSPCVMFKLIMVILHIMFNCEEFTQTIESPYQRISSKRTCLIK